MKLLDVWYPILMARKRRKLELVWCGIVVTWHLDLDGRPHIGWRSGYCLSPPVIPQVQS